MNLENYTEEIKKNAFEKTANIKIYQLYLILEIINLASTRGAFNGKEMSHIGSVFDTINSGIEKAFQLTKEECEKEKS
jgi:hypothetical protein